MPIKNKTDLKEYMAADLHVQPASTNVIKRLFFDDIVRLKKHLRYAEYHFNRGGVISCYTDITCYGYTIFVVSSILRFLLTPLVKD